MDNPKWYALFSHTGSEVQNIIGLTGVRPACILTDNLSGDYCIQSMCFWCSGSAKDINKWLLTAGNIEPGSLITLNGYMRIIPEEVLDYLYSIGCTVLNMHPAPIGMYPDLKGKDPQERLYVGLLDGTYNCIGATIHKVDAGVDTGEIVYEKTVLSLPYHDKDQLYKDLHRLSTDMWVDVFKEVYKFGQHH